VLPVISGVLDFLATAISLRCLFVLTVTFLYSSRVARILFNKLYSLFYSFENEVELDALTEFSLEASTILLQCY
jgi:hypothetical protein